MPKILVDHSKCTGCKLCQYVCSHNKKIIDGVNPKISSIKVITIGLFEADVPIVCRHCKKPLCKEKCPVNAFEYDQKLCIWNINKNKCIGCGICAEECPFGAIFIHSESPIPLKCDLCGGDPICVKNCVSGAVIYDDETRIGENLRENNALKTSGIREGR